MWMRDPIDRIRSWYDFWDAIEPSGEPHHMAFKDADMSLAEFARWEIVTGGFAEIFLDGTDGLDSFDFIGITERFDRCICIVVSEETGTLSLANQGKLERPITSSRLQELLRELFSTAESMPPARRTVGSAPSESLS